MPNQEPNTPTRKEVIMHEAALLFREKGYAATTMRDIAEKVGMEAASLYNHIASKQEILSELCFHIGNQYLLHLDSITAENKSATEKIKSLIALHLRITKKEVAASAVTNREWRHLEEPSFGAFLQLRKTYEEKMESIIRDGIEAGEFIEIHPQVAMYTILSALRWVESWYRSNRKISSETIERDILTFLENGLIKK